MKDTTIVEFVRSDGMARVEIFRREDGIYSFIEEMLLTHEDFITGQRTQYWGPRTGGGKCGSAEIALREAKGRIVWLRELLATE